MTLPVGHLGVLAPASIAALMCGLGPVAGAGRRGQAKPRPAGRDELPVRGLHVLVSDPAGMDDYERFVRDVLPAEGVNVLVAEIGYSYRFTSFPEVAEPRSLEEADLRRLAAACRESGIRFIPQINCLGHQSPNWKASPLGLLRAFPEFDETPWVATDDESRSIYCRSYCSLHPDVHRVLFGLIDEMADVAGTADFHVGLDEVFLLGEEQCPRCGGRDKAGLFGAEVNRLHDHLAKGRRTMWMWGDRFIDAGAIQIGKWEASEDGTHPAVDRVPKDIIICDWHYKGAPPTMEYFVGKGFRVVTCPCDRADVALQQLAEVRRLRRESEMVLGIMQTTWCPFDEFIRAYDGAETPRKHVAGAAESFRALFAAIRQGA